MAARSYSRDYDAVKRNYFAALNIGKPNATTTRTPKASSGAIGGGIRGAVGPMSPMAPAASASSSLTIPSLVGAMRDSSDDLFFGYPEMDDHPVPSTPTTPSRPVPGSTTDDEIDVAYSCPIPIKRGGMFDDEDDAAVRRTPLSLSLSRALPLCRSVFVFLCTQRHNHVHSILAVLRSTSSARRHRRHVLGARVPTKEARAHEALAALLECYQRRRLRHCYHHYHQYYYDYVAPCYLLLSLSCFGFILHHLHDQFLSLSLVSFSFVFFCCGLYIPWSGARLMHPTILEFSHSFRLVLFPPCSSEEGW